MILHYLEVMASKFPLFFYQILLTDEPEIGEERLKANSKEKRHLKW